MILQSESSLSTFSSLLAIDVEAEPGALQQVPSPARNLQLGFILLAVLPFTASVVLLVVLLRLREQRLTPPELLEGAASASSDGQPDSEELAGDVTQDEEEQESAPSTWIVAPAFVFAFVCNVVFTIAMPTSSAVADIAGGGKVLSGMLIASWAAGVGVALPILFFVGVDRLKTVYIWHGALTFLGSVVQLVGAGATSLPEQGRLFVGIYFVGRVLHGIAGGVNFTTALALTRCSSPRQRTEYFGYWFGAGSAGIVCGPLLSSLGEMFTRSFCGEFPSAAICAHHPDLMGPVVVLAVYGLAVFITMACLCPSDADLAAACDEPTMTAMKSNVEIALAPLRDAQASLGIAVMLITQLARTTMRVSWESGALLFLKDKGVSRVMAGGLVSSVTAAFVVGQMLVSGMLRASKTPPSDKILVLLFEGIGFLGLAVMFYGEVKPFMLGSILLYTGNSLTAAPTTNFCVRLGAAGSTWASTEGMLVANTAFWAASCFSAPLYTRTALNFGTPSAQALVLLLLPIVLCQVVVSGVAMSGSRLWAVPMSQNPIADPIVFSRAVTPVSSAP
mmetsp:Transcript_7399/g.16243  ORF Transcript_7399/g.16243 Transcript_7399/m.16243 type:complete len:562 (+) Transcript_7399:117-1802(+)